MSLLPMLAIAFGLAVDAFSVAVATGLALGHVKPRQAFRLSFHFGLFQFLMPILGWLAGTTVAQSISDYDHWLAFGLLGYVGGRMLWESVFDHAAIAAGAAGEAGPVGKPPRKDPTRGSSLVMLSVATSIDALAVGLTMALLGSAVLLPAVLIGVVAASMTLVGLRLGRHAGQLLGPWMERVGGVVLIAIGVKIVLEHTLG